MIQTHICPDCQTFLVAADLTDMVLLRASHHCASRQDRNITMAFGFPTETTVTGNYGTVIGPLPPWSTEDIWRNLLTVEDARFLAAMKIDPL